MKTQVNYPVPSISEVNFSTKKANSFSNISANTLEVVIAAEFANQGIPRNEIPKRTADALALAKLSGLDAEQAVINLTAAVNAFAGESKSLLVTTSLANFTANTFTPSNIDGFANHH